MNVLKNRAVLLLSAVAIAGTACSGSKGDAGAAGQPGPAGTNVGALSTSGLVVAVKSVKVNADKSVAVNFTVKDDQGYPVDLAGKYSTNTVIVPAFSLAQVNVAADGSVLPHTVLTQTASKTYTTTAPDPATLTLNPSSIAPANYADPKYGGALVENGSGAGDYTYTYPVTGGTYTGAGAGRYAGQNIVQIVNGVAVDPASNASFVAWIEMTRQTNLTNTTDASGFKAVNADYEFVPSGSGTPVKRELVTTANCANCHRGFRPQGTTTTKVFHGGTRVEAAYCNVCHNVARASTKTNSDGATPIAASGIAFHRVHFSEKLLRLTSGQSTTGYQPNGTASPTSCSTAKPCTCGDGTGTNKQPCVPNGFDSILDVTYPQDIRNCDACHKGAAQGAQAKTVASRAVCGSCHDYVAFDATSATGLSACVDVSGNAQFKDANGDYQKCVHAAGVNTDDTTCKGCHVAGGAGFIGDFHVPVAAPNPGNIFVPQTSGTATAGYMGGTSQNCATTACACTPTSPCFNQTSLSVVTKYTTSGTLLTGGTACGSGHKPSLYPACTTCSTATPCLGSGNNNTNAASLAAAGMVPTGATTFNYVIQSASRNSSNQPVIVFKLQKNGQDAAFDHCTALTPAAGSNELYDGFVGSPSLYFVWAIPQDGIAKPADFNQSASAYLRTVCNDGTTAKTKITGPDGSGFYTVTFTGTTVPASAVMLTAGVGYTYGLTSTQPLTQINLPAYPYTAATKQGGLTVAPANKTLAATGYTARRVIVDTAKCDTCHGQLGVNPTFHAGQRNDGPTCSWCHTPNKTSSGWAANAKDFIHAIHAGEDRTIAFNWHAAAPGQNFGDVTFPGPLNDCQACHVAGSYDFSATASAAAVPNLLPSYAATGTFNGSDTAVNFAFSPYVTQVTDATYPDPKTPTYGFGYATSSVTVTINDGSTPNTAAYTQNVNGTDKACSDAVTFPTGCVCTTTTPCTYTVKACTTAAPCDADGTSLVNSPITAACVACHDSPAAKGHMVGNGGLFYAPHSQFASQQQVAIGESCLLCHGAGQIAAIADVHR